MRRYFNLLQTLCIFCVDCFVSLDVKGQTEKRRGSQKYFMTEFQVKIKVDVTKLEDNKMAADLDLVIM